MWSVVSAVALRANSLTVRGGIVTVSSDDARANSKVVIELSGKGVLGQGGALQLARALSESAPPALSKLDLR